MRSLHLLAIIGAIALLTSSWAMAQRAPTQQGDNAAAQHFKKAADYAQKGDTEKAIFEFKEVLKINPNVVEAYLNLGQLYAMRKDPKNSIKWLKAGMDKTKKGNPMRAPLRLMWARVALSFNENTQEAEKVLKAHVAEFPNDPEGRQLLAGIYARQRKTKEAIEQFDAWAKADPKSFQPHLYRGGALADSGQFDKAIEAYRKALQLATDNKIKAQICVYIGQAQYRKDDLTAALASVKQGLEFDPKNVDLYIAHGALAMEARDYASGEQALRKALTLLKPDDPRVAEVKRSILDALITQQKTDEIIAYYQEELKSDPDNAQLHAQLASTYQYSGKDDEAIAEYEKAAALDPKSAQPLAAIADIYQRKGEIDKAVAAFRRISELDPGQAEVTTMQIVDLYREAKRTDDAVAEMRKLIETNKADPEKAKDITLYIEIGNTYFAADRTEDAIAALDEAKQVNPESIEPYRAIATHYSGAGKTAEAEAQYSAYLAKFPNSGEALRNLSQLAVGRKDDETAYGLLKQALGIDSADVQALRLIAPVLKRLNRQTETDAFYQVALIKAPENVELRRDYGALLDGMLEYARAAEQYEKILELSPGDSQSRSRLAKVYDKLERYDEAIELEKQAIASDATGRSWGASYNSLLNLYEKKADLDAYIEFLTAQFTIKPDNRMTITALRTAVERAKKPEGLAPTLEKLLTANPDSILLLETLVDECSKGEQYAKAAEYGKKLIVLKPADFNSYLRLAGVYQKQGELDLAVSQYKRAHDLEPKNPTAMSSIAEIYDSKGKYVEAAEWYTKLCDAYPTRTTDRRALANCYEKAGELDKAKAEYWKIVEVAPTSPSKKEAALKLYEYAKEAGTTDAFLQSYKDLLAKKPDDNALWLTYQNVVETMGIPGEYATTLTAAFEKDPKRPSLARALATLRIEEGNKEAVDSVLSRFIEAGDADVPSLRMAGDLYKRAGMADEAIAVFTKAVEAASDRSAQAALPPTIGLGQAYMLKEDWANAVIWLEKAQGIESSQQSDGRMPSPSPNPTIAKDLARCYEQLGRDRDALDQLERIGSFGPDDQEMTEMIKRLRTKLGLPPKEDTQEKTGGGVE